MRTHCVCFYWATTCFYSSQQTVREPELCKPEHINH